MSAFLLDLLQFKAFPVVLNLMFSFRWGRNSEAVQYRRKFSCLPHPAFPRTRSALALISSSAGRQSQQDWLLRTQKWICQCKQPITCQKTFQEPVSKTVIWCDSPLERKIELTLNSHRVQGDSDTLVSHKLFLLFCMSQLSYLSRKFHASGHMVPWGCWFPLGWEQEDKNFWTPQAFPPLIHSFQIAKDERVCICRVCFWWWTT